MQKYDEMMEEKAVETMDVHDLNETYRRLKEMC